MWTFHLPFWTIVLTKESVELHVRKNQIKTVTCITCASVYLFNRYIWEQLILTINWWVFIFCKIHVHWTYCKTQINTCALDRCLSVMILIHASWLHLLCSRLTTGVFTFMLLHAFWYKNRKQTKAFGKNMMFLSRLYKLCGTRRACHKGGQRVHWHKSNNIWLNGFLKVFLILIVFCSLCYLLTLYMLIANSSN